MTYRVEIGDGRYGGFEYPDSRQDDAENAAERFSRHETSQGTDRPVHLFYRGIFSHARGWPRRLIIATYRNGEPQ